MCDLLEKRSLKIQGLQNTVGFTAPPLPRSPPSYFSGSKNNNCPLGNEAHRYGN